MGDRGGAVSDRAAGQVGEVDEHVTHVLRRVLVELEELKLSKNGRPRVMAAVDSLEASTRRAISDLRQDDSSSSTEGLTRREVEILKLLGQGMTNKQIGSMLHISEKTVRNHVSNFYSKLKVADRLQAVLYAVRKGLIEP